MELLPLKSILSFQCPHSNPNQASATCLAAEGVKSHCSGCASPSCFACRQGRGECSYHSCRQRDVLFQQLLSCACRGGREQGWGRESSVATQRGTGRGWNPCSPHPSSQVKPLLSFLPGRGCPVPPRGGDRAPLPPPMALGSGRSRALLLLPFQLLSLPSSGSRHSPAFLCRNVRSTCSSYPVLKSISPLSGALLEAA